jgi:hypothetical protein
MPYDFDEVREALTQRLKASGAERNLIFSKGWKGWKAWREKFITSTEGKQAFPSWLPPRKWQQVLQCLSFGWAPVWSTLGGANPHPPTSSFY